MTDPTPPAAPMPATSAPTPSQPDRPQRPFRRPPPRRDEPEPSRPPVLDRQDLNLEPPKLRELDAAIEDELEAALAGFSADDLSAEPAKQERKDPAAPKGPQRGKVIAIHHADVFVEVPGGKSQGVMSLTQFDEAPKVGDIVEFSIERYDAANGLLVLTRQGAAVAADWSSVHIGQIVEARVTGTNKGGLAVEVNGIRAFLPISQIDLYRVENVEQFVNQRLLCMVAEVYPEEKNLVLSRRALLEKEREEKAEKLWVELNEGQVRKGVVRGIKPFGAFVDLGGVDGLIPVGEISWGRLNDPSEVLQIGQAVEVFVARLDRERRKVGLSLRHLLASPYEKIAGNYPPRSLASGTVTRLAEFGAFVELEPGVEGLIHVSELAPQRVFNVGAVVKVGQTVEVMILSVDPEKKRISLSLKQANMARQAAAKAAEPVQAEPEPEAEEPAKVRKPRTTPLRGGTGDGGPLFPNFKNG
jgi:small subunit ribosomal protein S1